MEQISTFSELFLPDTSKLNCWLRSLFVANGCMFSKLFVIVLHICMCTYMYIYVRINMYTSIFINIPIHGSYILIYIYVIQDTCYENRAVTYTHERSKTYFQDAACNIFAYVFHLKEKWGGVREKDI